MRVRKRSLTGNLDSLLDTMTNVVGILLILLAVTQLGVGDAVKRIQHAESGKADEEYQKTVSKTHQLAGDLEQEKARPKEINAALPEHQAGLAKKQNEIVEVKLQIAELEKIQAETEKTLKETEAQRQKVRLLETQFAQIDEQVARLKAQLDATPGPPPPPPPKIVTLPNPRAAPKDAHPVEFVCQYGRIVPFNPGGLRRIAQVRINRSQKELRKGDRIDCKKLTAIFEEEDIGNAYFRLKIKTENGVPRLLLHQRPDAGDGAADLPDRKSTYQQILSEVDKKKEYLRFHVYPDSYGTYLAAREVALRPYNLNAGWDPAYPGHVHEIDMGFRVTVYCADYTPPPAPPAERKGPPETGNLLKRLQGKLPPKDAKAPPPPLPNDDID